MNKKVVYLVDTTIHKGIFTSQLLTPLIISKDKNAVLIVPESLHDLVSESNLPNKMMYRKNVDKYRRLMQINQIDLVYTRSIWEFFILYYLRVFFFRKFKILYDFRGLVAEESAEKSSKLGGVKFKLLNYFQKFAYKNADQLRTVSQRFKEFLIEKYGNQKKEFKVIPCCVPAKQIQLGHFINKRDIRFVYLGSVNEWQKFDETILTYKFISENLSNTSLTVITKDIQKASKICDKYQVKAVIKTLPQEQVARELQSFDFGFLIRDDIPMNNVASPVKFLEYLSQGVIPLISEGVGDYTEIVKSKDLGIVLNNSKDHILKEIERLRFKDPEIHQRLYQLVQKYTWEKQLLD
jgi:glycosyltransferase involved in cell wall biosynthesis